MRVARHDEARPQVQRAARHRVADVEAIGQPLVDGIDRIKEQVPEVIGVDLWMDAEKMNGYYDLGLGFDALGPVFAGEPDTSVWQSAPGDWTEW